MNAALPVFNRMLRKSGVLVTYDTTRRLVDALDVELKERDKIAEARERNRVLSIINQRLVPLMYGVDWTKEVAYQLLRDIRSAIEKGT